MLTSLPPLPPSSHPNIKISKSEVLQSTIRHVMPSKHVCVVSAGRRLAGHSSQQSIPCVPCARLPLLHVITRAMQKVALPNASFADLMSFLTHAEAGQENMRAGSEHQLLSGTHHGGGVTAGAWRGTVIPPLSYQPWQSSLKSYEHKECHKCYKRTSHVICLG